MKIPESDIDEEEKKKLLSTGFFFGVLLVSGFVLQVLNMLLSSPEFLNNWLAMATTYLLDIVGDFSQNGRFIYGSNIYEVTRDCLGWKSVYGFISLSIASWKLKKPSLNSLITGTLIISFLNLLRIFTTVIISELGLVSFEIIHSLLWRWSLTFATFLIWLIWLKIDYKNLWSPNRGTFK